MRRGHSFYIIDSEYCVDAKGLLTYLANKIAARFICVFCENANTRNFKTSEAVQNHMVLYTYIYI